MTKKFPAFTVECSSAGYGPAPDYVSPAPDYDRAEQTRFVASWEDDGARYHIWLSEKGTKLEANAVIHKNIKRPEGVRFNSRDHRALAIDSKANAPFVEHIRESIRSGTLARAAFNTKRDQEQAKEDAVRKAYADKMRAALMKVTEEASERISGFAEIVADIAELSDESLIRLANIIRSA